MRSCLSGSKELYTFNICIPTRGNAELYACIYLRDTDMYLSAKSTHDVLAESTSHISRAPRSGRMNTECLIITEFYVPKAP